MPAVMYATIEIGSYNLSLEIFEMTKKDGLRSIDQVTHRIPLGKTSYALGKITAELIDELCTVVKDFTEIMKGYQITEYRAYSTSAIREAKNSIIALETIYQRTGVHVDILSNSEQRFLGYKGIASKVDTFHKIIQKGTAILDVSGGSIQISLFDKDNLITTQNVKLGSLRIREHLKSLENAQVRYETLVEELIRDEINGFSKMHLKDRKINNVILIGNNFTDSLLYTRQKEYREELSRETFMEWYKTVISNSPLELAVKIGIPMEYASLMIPTAIINKRLIEAMDADHIWVPGIRLAHGVAYDYAEKKKIIKSEHNFENDIVMAARNIGRRYAVSKNHVQNIGKMARAIFSAMKRIHGLSSRELLLLEVATWLHDCGRYISLANVGECSYNIIMATEIIGLSHRERQIIALVVRYNTRALGSYYEVSRVSDLSADDYTLIAKLTAILRLANAMDRSHLQKIETIKAVLKENELILTLEVNRDFALETGLLRDKIDFFEEVYSIRPVLKVRRTN